MGAEYIVKDIINVRIRGGEYEFLVDWEGYGPEDRTWEPFESFDYGGKRIRRQTIKTFVQRQTFAEVRRQPKPHRRRHKSTPSSPKLNALERRWKEEEAQTRANEARQKREREQRRERRRTKKAIKIVIRLGGTFSVELL